MMIIIGEKINGSIPSTATAIAERDEAYIRELARRQTEFGADYLDVNAGTTPDIEAETLRWIIGLVQDEVDTPLCIDSSSPDVILEMLPYAKKPGMINSVSGEHGKCEKVFSKAAGTEWKIIALTCDSDGISTDSDVKYEIACSIMEKADSFGIAHERIFIDSLVNTVGTTPLAQASFTSTVRRIRETFPKVHLTSGLSNISHGMPYRKAINQCFLTLAMNAGIDSAIMDPTNAGMRATLYATQVLLGQDKNYRQYFTAFRKGIIGPPKKD
jgi:5-methyltetrahydrofolate--homocysteine methyltransferase